jgi:hypothetical protein
MLAHASVDKQQRRATPAFSVPICHPDFWPAWSAGMAGLTINF